MTVFYNYELWQMYSKSFFVDSCFVPLDGGLGLPTAVISVSKFRVVSLWIGNNPLNGANEACSD